MRSLIRFAALAALPAAASAHEPAAAPALRAQLDPVPWQQLTVQVHHTLAPQLVVENRGAVPIEILDPAGRAFLRIGGDGVEGDLNAAAWYQTYSTAGIPVPPAARDRQAPARWLRVSAGHAWGWFDPRIALEPAPAPGSAWRIPVRLGAQVHALTGRFLAGAPGHGRFDARLEGVLPEGVTLQIVPGPLPAIFLSHAGREPLIVLGLEGEHYLRFANDGVSVNLRSATWRRYGRNTGLAQEIVLSPGDSPFWVRVSTQRRYTWLEPRLQGEGTGGQRHWTVPMQLGERRVTLGGTTRPRD